MVSLLRDRLRAGSKRWTPAWPSPATASPSKAPELTLCPMRTFCCPGCAVDLQRAMSPTWLAWGRRRFRSGERASTSVGKHQNHAIAPNGSTVVVEEPISNSWPVRKRLSPLFSESFFSRSFHLPSRPASPFNLRCRQALIGERFVVVVRGSESDGASRTSVHNNPPG